jgi:Tfp pilus assembly protein PilN
MATDYPTKDGSAILSIDKLEVGGLVTIGGQPAPDAEYQLTDNSIVQTQGGVIIEISSPSEDLIPEELKMLPGKMAAIEQKFAEHQASFNQIKQDFATAQSTIQKQDEALKGLLSVVEQLAAIPKTEPAAAPYTFRDQKSSRIDEVIKNLKTLKNK